MLEFDLFKYAIHKDEQLGYNHYIQKPQKELSDAESELEKSEKKSASSNYTYEQWKLLRLKAYFLFALLDNGQQGNYTLLHVDVGCKDVMEFLSDDVVHSNIQSSDGNILLYIAVSKGNREIVDMLLDKEPDLVDIQDSYGDAPLHIAVFKGDREIVDMVLNTIINGDSSALLYVPDSQGNIEIIEILLDTEPALITIRDKNGNTPLHLAVLKKKIKAVRTLLANKAYRDVLNKTFCTPLDYVNHNTEIMKLFTDVELFSECASLIENKKTQNNIETETQVETETHVAMQKNDIDKHFINRKATIDNTALHIAACRGDRKIVKVLRDKGQGFNRQNKYGNTTLCIAVSQWDGKVVKMSFGKEPDLINRHNRYSETPLNNDKQDGKTERMSVVLAKQEERAREEHIPYGDIPLDYVCQDNRTKIMKFFTGLFGFASSAKNSEIQNKKRTEKQITVKNDVDTKHTCVTEQHALKSTFLKKEMSFSQKLNPIPLQRQNLNSKDQSILVQRGKPAMVTVNIDAKECMNSLKKKKCSELTVSTKLREVKYDNISVTRIIF